MSLATSLRTFLKNLDGPIVQVAQSTIPAHYKFENGMIWFARRATQPVRTMQRATGAPDQQFFDVEIYHPEIDVVEPIADELQTFDCYRGELGDGTIQGMFVETQSDEYVPRVDMTDTENLASAFLSLEVRSYKEN